MIPPELEDIDMEPSENLDPSHDILHRAPSVDDMSIDEPAINPPNTPENAILTQMPSTPPDHYNPSDSLSPFSKKLFTTQE